MAVVVLPMVLQSENKTRSYRESKDSMQNRGALFHVTRRNSIILLKETFDWISVKLQTPTINCLGRKFATIVTPLLLTENHHQSCDGGIFFSGFSRSNGSLWISFHHFFLEAIGGRFIFASVIYGHPRVIKRGVAEGCF